MLVEACIVVEKSLHTFSATRKQGNHLSEKQRTSEGARHQWKLLYSDQNIF